MAVQTYTTRASGTKNDEPPHDPVLDMAAEWQLARAKAHLTWATGDVATGFGRKDSDFECNTAAIAEMEGCAAWLAKLEPTTVLGVRETLNVVPTILAHREIFPDQDVLSDGPILQILRNARGALEGLDGDMPVRG
jgi:hypothetical protein